MKPWDEATAAVKAMDAAWMRWLDAAVDSDELFEADEDRFQAQRRFEGAMEQVDGIIASVEAVPA